MSDPARSPRRRGDVVRRAVLAAAADEVAAGGIEAASVAAIAARAGVHETSIYRRWKTRENLLVDALLDRSAQAIPIPDTGSIRTDLITLVRLLSSYLGSPLGTALLRAGVLAVDDRYAHARQVFWDTRRAALLVVIDRAINRGELLPGTDARLTLEALLAPLHLRILLTGEPLDDTLPEQLTDLVLNGISQPSITDKAIPLS